MTHLPMGLCFDVRLQPVSVIGSQQWRAEKSRSSGGAAEHQETSDRTDACLFFFEAESCAAQHVWTEQEP